MRARIKYQVSSIKYQVSSAMAGALEHLTSTMTTTGADAREAAFGTCGTTDVNYQDSEKIIMSHEPYDAVEHEHHEQMAQNENMGSAAAAAA